MNHAAADVRYRWKLLRAGPILLDGGGMFGLIPRVVWSRSIPSDEQGRIALSHNCLLLERTDEFGHAHRFIIETGSGDKFDEKFRKIFGLTDRTVLTAVEEIGLHAEDIGHVIVTHLHFDHAGGATRRARPGETADWTDAAGQGVKLTFPRAAIHTQRQEWEDALANRSVMTRTYFRENLEPLRERLRLADSPPPFPPGQHLERDERPATPLIARETEILPGIHVFLTPGHTWGQQAIRFTDDRGRTVVFTPDVMPTTHHLGAAYNLAYDVEPYVSSISRRWFLAEAVAGNWLLVLNHEPGNPLVRVKPDSKGWYTLVPEEL